MSVLIKFEVYGPELLFSLVAVTATHVRAIASVKTLTRGSGTSNCMKTRWLADAFRAASEHLVPSE